MHQAFGKWPGKGDFFGGQIPEMLPEEAQAQAATAAEAFQQQQQWYPDWYASPPPMQAVQALLEDGLFVLLPFYRMFIPPIIGRLEGVKTSKVCQSQSHADMISGQAIYTN